jgi:aspartyl-tRNA(Asn)/glutamyl-tRNA(Gln) amidotransferase subunit B
MNKEALDKIIKAGLLLGCEIAPLCKWDRKNYFYPDSPKNYQISQYDQPLCKGGQVEIELPGTARNIMGEHKHIALTRIHLEEDVGKLNHGDGGSLVDFNRAGTPLMEIVSEPVIRSAEEAFAYLTALKAVMIYGGISDCDMEKGQLRCDANISIRPVGETRLGTKVELKNLNSISFVRDGISQEIRRQTAVVLAGGKIDQETRDYDGQTGASKSLRSKEMAHDYRYFPDPDLMPVEVGEDWKAEIRELGDFFEEAARLSGKPQAAGNWIVNDLLRELGSAKIELAQSKVRPGHVAGLVRLVEEGVVLSNAAKEVFIDMFQTGEMPEAVVARKGLKAETNLDDLEKWCAEAIAGNPKSVADFKGGKDSAINALKGPVMKAAKGKADPRRVDDMLRRLLGQ